ncbi:MAG: ATP-binding protein [Sedimentisphaeraceae bacterium JB056]
MVLIALSSFSGSHLASIADGKSYSMYIVALFALTILFSLMVKIQNRRTGFEKNRYKSILKSIGDAVITTDSKGIIDNINSIAENLTGWDSESAYGRHVSEIFKITDESKTVIADPITEILNKKKWTRLNEATLNSKNGVSYKISIDASPIFYEHSTKAQGAVLIFHDVTDVYERKQQLKAMLEAIPDIIIHEDIDGNCYRIHFPKHTKGQCCDIEKCNSLKVLPQKRPASHLKHLKRAIETGEPQVYQHSTIKNNAKCWEEVRIAPINQKEVIVMIRDISKVKEYELELIKAREIAENANNTKSDFLAHITHELRTPMGGILGTSELLSDTNLDVRQKEYVNMINESGKSLLTIVNDLLDISKIEAGKMQIRPEKFNISKMLSHLESVTKGLIKGKNVELITDYRIKDNQIVETDKIRLAQILTNLIGNAVKFTEIGSVTLRVCETENPNKNNKSTFTFEVIDTGIGIPQELQNKIFEKFEQVDSSSHRKYKGTGLGLSISMSLSRLLGGNLDLKSEINKGSTFRLTLELPVSRTIESLKIKRTPQKKLNIAVADDNHINRLLITDFISKLNHNVTVTQDGKELVENLDKNNFDLILMDINMPVMDGFEAASIIRNCDKKYSHIPIIGLTADALSDIKDRCIESGMNGCLAKPFTFLELKNTIEDSVSGCQRPDQST